jgi:inosine-uridine nucleoside N-ribohydrolase
MDAIAAHVILSSGVEVVLVPIDATNPLFVSADIVNSFAAENEHDALVNFTSSIFAAFASAMPSGVRPSFWDVGAASVALFYSLNPPKQKRAICSEETRRVGVSLDDLSENYGAVQERYGYEVSIVVCC